MKKKTVEFMNFLSGTISLQYLMSSSVTSMSYLEEKRMNKNGIDGKHWRIHFSVDVSVTVRPTKHYLLKKEIEI